MKTSVFFTLVLAGLATLCAEPQFSGIAPLKDQPALILAGDGTDPAPVFFPVKAERPEIQAAQELARYLGEISGATFAANRAPDPLPERAVLVGRFGKKSADGLSREGFVIRAQGSRLEICGGTPRATLYAVFALLEEQLGCRWWSWDEEDVPKLERIEIAAQNTLIEPAFEIHDLYNHEAQAGQNFFAYKRRGKSGTSFTAVHNLCPMLQPFAKERPDFLPTDKNGERKFNNIHMNYTAPGMAEIVAEQLGKQVEKRKRNLADFLYTASMGDWYGGMDFSDASKRVYEEESWTDPDGREKPGYCATMLRMVNQSAEILAAKFPEIRVATHAYMSLEAPPAKTRPRGNVVVEIPRLRHDTVRSIEESEKNQSFRRNLDRWCEIAPGRVYIWEYGVNFNNFIKPFPCLRSLAANLKYYHQVGVAGVRIQGNYVSKGGDLVVLKNYVWGKLLWDPTRDVDELIREFCEGYYGPAADEMIAYVELMENSVRGEDPVQADEFEKDFTKWLRPEIVDAADRLLKGAHAKAKGSDPYERRVREANAGMEAFRLWTPGELVERGEQLVRADFGESTLPRARELLSHIRGASPREWGNGRGYQMGFLTTHGGPMPILTAGEVTVKIAPMQGGRIRSVLLGDVVAIDESRDLLKPGAHFYELSSHDGNRVEMEAELGIAHWSPATKQWATRAIQLGEDGLVRTTGAVRLAEKSRETANQPAVETVFHCGDAPEQILVEYQDANGAWTAAKVTRETPTAQIEAAQKFRITRSDRGVIVLDSYENATSALVEFVAKKAANPGKVRLVVNLAAVSLAGNEPQTYVSRELRVIAAP